MAMSRSPSVAESEPLWEAMLASCSAAWSRESMDEGWSMTYLVMPSKIVLALVS